MDYDLDQAIRKIADFPKPGILFYDITGILTTPAAFAYVLEKMKTLYAAKPLSAVAAVESRGFVFAAPLAIALGLPLILIRKKGKLPGKTYQKSYALEYDSAIIEVHVSDIPRGGNILLVDDLLATGGTLKAACELLEEGEAKVTELFCVVGLPFLHPEKSLGSRKVTTLLNYQS